MSHELSFRELTVLLWARKVIIALTVALFTLVFGLVAFFSTDIYRAEVKVVSNVNPGQSNLATLARQYGGLARLAGISLPADETTQLSVGLAVLQSRQFINEFVNSRDLKVALMASKGYDKATEMLIIDSDIFDSSSLTWVRDLEPPYSAEPNATEVYEAFLENLSVYESAENGVISISFEHYSPQVASDTVTWLVEDLNKRIMGEEVSRAERVIQYLNEQAIATSIAEVKQVFYELIKEQIKTMILARESDEYLIRTIDPAVPPLEKTAPNRPLIVIIGALFGLFLSTGGALVHGALRERP